jgi:hypothetical protein
MGFDIKKLEQFKVREQLNGRLAMLHGHTRALSQVLEHYRTFTANDFELNALEARLEYLDDCIEQLRENKEAVWNLFTRLTEEE